MRRGTVHHRSAQRGYRHAVQTLRVAGAVEVFDLVARLRAMLAHGAHEGTFAHARAALDKVNAPRALKRQYIVKVIYKPVRRVAARKKIHLAQAIHLRKHHTRARGGLVRA